MDIHVFNNERFGSLRTYEEDGQILFCGKDVAKALGYAKPNNAINSHCEGALKRYREHGYLGKTGSNRNEPTQRAMEKGLFRIKETAVTHSEGHVTINRTPKVTGKGQRYFIEAFAKRGDLVG